MKLFRLNDTNVINIDQIVLVERKTDCVFLQLVSMPGISLALDSRSEALWMWALEQASSLTLARSDIGGATRPGIEL
jgi:hypothetical protein